MIVIVRGRTRPWGTLGVHTTRPRSFSPDDIGFLQSAANVLALAIERHEVELAQRRETAALAESEARFAKIFQASPVALGMSTVEEGRIIDVNESWLELLGYRREEVIGRTNAELNLSVDPGARTETIRRARAEGVVRNLEVKVRRKSGEVRDLLVSAVPVGLAGDRPAWLSAQIDITDRKRVEDERARLFVSETQARTLAETALERLRAIQSITDSALHHLGLDELLHELLGRLQAALDATPE